MTLYLGAWAPVRLRMGVPDSEGRQPYLRVGIGTPLSVRDDHGVPIPVKKSLRPFHARLPQSSTSRRTHGWAA